MAKTRSIVTGGAGFIGSHLVDYLIKEKHEVIVLDNFSTGRAKNLDHVKEKIKIIECDISKKGDWYKYFKNTDYVFHLAALADIVPSIQYPKRYFDANVTGTFNIIEAIKKYKVKKFIYTASSSCYGVPNLYPTNENSEINPRYPYALTKYLGEKLVMHWSDLYELNAISLRFFNVYGTRSRTSGTYGAVFGVFLAQKISGNPFTVVGDGNQTRDFTYVSDAVEAIIVAAKSDKKNKIYNVGSGKHISVNYLIELLKGKKVFIQKRQGEPDCTFADITKIKTELNWTPKISIEEGVEKILKKIDYWKEAPVWTPEKIKIETKDWFKYIK